VSAKPQPRVITEVCSLCGLDWKRHGKEPTSDKCIELLLQEVRSLNAQLASRPYVQPIPYPLPYLPRPYPRPWWQQTWGNQYTYASNATARSPQIVGGSHLSITSGS
jgi:hypothetical protein